MISGLGSSPAYDGKVIIKGRSGGEGGRIFVTLQMCCKFYAIDVNINAGLGQNARAYTRVYYAKNSSILIRIYFMKQVPIIGQ